MSSPKLTKQAKPIPTIHLFQALPFPTKNKVWKTQVCKLYGKSKVGALYFFTCVCTVLKMNSQFWEGQNWSVFFCTQTSIVPCTPDEIVTFSAVRATPADLSLRSISCADIYRILWLYALGKGMFMWSRKSEGQIHYKWIVVLSSCAFTLTAGQTGWTGDSHQRTYNTARKCYCT